MVAEGEGELVAEMRQLEEEWLAELEDPETISVVVGESQPPRIIIFPSSPGRLQQRWPSLFCLSVREGRGETSVPVILSQDCHDDVGGP